MKKKITTIDKEFETTKEMVEYVLERYPHTRNSDTALFLQCYRVLGCNTIDDMENIDLRLHSVDRFRRVIQNKEGRFLPTETVQALREERQSEVRNYMRKEYNA